MEHDSKFTSEQKIQILLSRLDWPSGLVRERACVELALLLSKEAFADQVKKAVLNWMSSQALESVQALGLLPFIYAQDNNYDTLIPTEKESMEAIRHPSLLSWILLKQLYPGTSLAATTFLDCSRAEFSGSEHPFFRKYVTGYLPPIYDFWASKIEERGTTFKLQWALEWQTVLDRLGREPSADEGDYWFRRLPNAERHVIADTEMSEVYRSSYLRALAWLVIEEGFPIETASFFAAGTCPIDLELWKLEPQSRPSWWPHPKSTATVIDTTIADLWMDIDHLWNKIASGDKASENEWAISQATGTVQSAETSYEVKIHALFQKCLGPNEPDPRKLLDWCDGNDGKVSNTLEFQSPSAVRFRGDIVPRNLDAFIGHFGDWSIIAASNYCRVYPRWQPWRSTVFLPSPVILDSPAHFAVERQELEVKEGDKIIAKYVDWTYSIRETKHPDLPFQAGHYLVVSRDVINRFCAKTNSTFCWLATIATQYKKEPHDDEFVEFSDYRILGSSKVVRL